MEDYGTRMRESVERQLEIRLLKTYTEAQKDILKKLDEFTSKYKAKDKTMREKVDKGLISEDKYKRWLAGQVFMGAQWEEKVKDITDTLSDIRKDDLKMIHDRQIDVFTSNANYQAYKMEHDIGKNFGFDLYDVDTVKKLVSEKPELLPRKIVDRKKHNHWNQGIIANAVTQGIIQGESIPKIAARIANTTANHDLKASTLYARTAMTCAQNSGRMQMLRDSKAMGINVKKKWMATHDARTRDSHIHLDGQVQEVEKPFKSDFGNIEFPGDPKAYPGDVYNCRCTLVYVYPEYEDMSQYPDLTEEEKDMTYREWETMKEGKEEEKTTQIQDKIDIPVQGKDITESWERRSDDFQFGIQDAIDAQGFDGKPIVVSQDEFDKAVQESGIIAQRGYNAPSEEALDEYQKALYDGDFYVECAGGSAYGKGMYSSVSLDGAITEDMERTAQHYSEGIGKVETFTVQPDTKLVEYDQLMEEFTGRRLYGDLRKEMLQDVTDQEMPYVLTLIGEAQPNMEAFAARRAMSDERLDLFDDRKASVMKKAVEKSREMMKKCDGDIGTFATLRGYDGTLCNNDKYAVIYNRTKLIFLGGSK